MEYDPLDYSERVLALALFLECDPDELSESRYDDAIIEHYRDSYLVLTDDEADKRARECASNLADEALDQIPDHLQRYFDEELYIQETLEDGRGWLLNHQNDAEEEVDLDGTTYYIYEQ